MNLGKPLILIGLFVLVSTQLLAQKNTQYPEAYAGLGKNAYHLLELNNNKTSQLSFKLKDKSINLDLGSSVKNNALNTSFSQTIPGGFISATKGDSSLFGQLHLDNKHYILTTNQSGIWAVELPQEGLQFNDCGLNHDHTLDVVKLDQKPAVKVAGTVIDVLMIYDQAIRDRYPGNLLQTRVDQYFHVSNQTFANSGLDLAIKQVGLEQVGYDFNDTNEGLRDLIIQTLEFGVGVRGLEALPQLYNETGADLVIFLRTHNIETRGNCGIAKFPEQVNGVFNKAFGVNVMADGMSSWSICTDQLMVHEIGHNLGAGHHNTNVNQRYIPDAAGFAKLGQFGTVMGSFGTGDPNRFFELNYFSNPNIQCGGGPCGIPGTANNANIINQLMGPVSNYNTSTSNTPNPPDYDVLLTDLDGDGVTDDIDEFPFDANETTDSDGDGVGDNSDAFPQNANEQIDSDGDGQGDHADTDDDNDGTPDSSDTFPLDAAESWDADFDGVGDNADAFDFEYSESKDADEDGVGNNEDLDDDNDGVVDVSDTLQDLLVINVGNNRILRFDAQTGLAKGIEVLPKDGLLTFQSDLALDHNKQRLYYSSASSIRSHDLLNRDAATKLLLPAYAENDQPQIGTGFPTALEIVSSGNSSFLITGKLRDKLLSSYFLQNPNQPLESLYAQLADEEAAAENVIDLYLHNDQMYVLSQTTRAFRISDSGLTVNQIGNANMAWLVDPYAFVVTDEAIMIHTDQSRNKLVMTDGNSGTYQGVFADLEQLGYSNPTGIQITHDGRLLVAVSDQNTLLEFDLDTQQFLGELVSGSGLDQPHRILLVPQLQDRFHEDANKVLRPNAGNWYNPATSGRGFNIGVFDNRLQVLWFTYDDDGNPIWYTAADFLLGQSFESDLLKTQQQPDGSVTFTTIGQISLEFVNERGAMINWQIGPDSGQEPIQWLQFSLEPDVADYTGMWTRPDAPGWGTAMIHNGDKTVAIPFIYDADGEPRWAISDVSEGIQPFNFAMNTVFSDTLCPTCSGESNVRLEPAGNMMFNLSNQPYWNSDLSWPTPLSGDWNLIQSELIRISSDPTRPR